MNRPAALRRAARIVDARRIGSCDAICEATADVSDERYVALLIDYRDLMRPANAMDSSFWWGKPWACTPAEHTARVLGLLFAAEALQ